MTEQKSAKVAGIRRYGARRRGAPTDPLDGHGLAVAQDSSAVEGTDSPAATTDPTPTAAAPPGPTDTSAANEDPAPTSNALPRPSIADPLLALLADAVDDLERTRIANENRVRQLTRAGEDSDGAERGFGLTLDQPQVASLARVVAGLADLEAEAVLNLRRRLRQHPLGAWIQGQVGIGEKQGARLLAAIGDPYWNTLYGRPRTVSELWAFCGLHVLPAGQPPPVAHLPAAGGDQTDPGHNVVDAQSARAGIAHEPPAGQCADDPHGDLVGGAQTDPGQDVHDTQDARAGVAHEPPAGHHGTDAHTRSAGGDQTDLGHPPSGTHSKPAGVAHVLPAGQAALDSHVSGAGGAQNGPGHSVADTHSPRAGVDHELPVGHHAADAPGRYAGGAQTDPGHNVADTQSARAGVAPSRQRGQRTNWSTAAKMRVYLIAETCIKFDGKPDKNDQPRPLSPYRAVYDEGRAKYAGAVHPAVCRRCGPSGHPAAVGSPLSPGHQHARGLRLVMKAILRDLWIEARGLHGDHAATTRRPCP
jgi:hypothetical protein